MSCVGVRMGVRMGVCMRGGGGGGGGTASELAHPAKPGCDTDGLECASPLVYAIMAMGRGGGGGGGGGLFGFCPSTKTSQPGPGDW